MQKRLATMFLIGLLAMVPGAALAEHGDHSLEQVLVESADTAAEHNALATHYRAEATEARAEAKRHEKMGTTYAQGKAMERLKMQRHCNSIAEDFNKQAAGFDALAELHDAEARKSK